jgi:hypothetical protein
MSDLYDEEPESKEDYEEEQWEPSDEEAELIEEQPPEMVAPAAYPGKEDVRTWNPDSAFGIKGTIIEGKGGKAHQRALRITRTPEERFRDNVERAGSSANADVDRGTVNAVLRLIPAIPDIHYKSPAGCLLGWMFRKYLGKKLTPAEKREVEIIMGKAAAIKDKHLMITDLDVIRYSRAWNLWLGKGEPMRGPPCPS